MTSFSQSRFLFSGGLVLAALGVAGCVTTGAGSGASSTPVVAHAGWQSDVEEIDATAFGAAAYATPGEGKGGIQPGKARYYVTSKSFRVYRVFSSSNPASSTGGWWTADPPGGTRSAYRVSYEICTAWNPQMDTLISCDLKAGAKFATGPGESVDGPKDSALGCGSEAYPDDGGGHLQMMLLRPVVDQIENCQQGPVDWTPQ